MEVLLCVFFSCLTNLVSASPKEKIQGRVLDDSDLLQNVQLEVDEEGQCMFVRSEEGVYSFASPGTTGNTVCGLYIIAEPSQIIEFRFQSFDISCSKRGLLSIIDGWELNGQFFPSSEDHQIPHEKRYAEVCGKTKPKKSYKTHQNVGLLEFRIPNEAQGFTVLVKFHDNPKPCNAVLQSSQGTYTVRNYNRRSNCSVSVIFPLAIRLLTTSVGIESTWTPAFETGLLSKCRKRGFQDFVEILGGDGLDPKLMKIAIDYCGLRSRPNDLPLEVGCGHTAVRLVSSGHFDNSVTFSFELADFTSLDLACPAFLDSLDALTPLL